MAMYTDVDAVRARSWHYSFPEVANCARMTLGELRSFSWGGKAAYVPTPEQIHQLSLRMQLYKPDEGSAFVAIQMQNCCG